MYSVNLLLTQAKRRCLNKQTLHLSRSLRERLDMRKTLVLQRVLYVGQNGCQTRMFVSYQEHFMKS